MHGSLREPAVPSREAQAPARSPPTRPATAAGGPASVAALLQRTAGNRAVAALLAPRAPTTTATTAANDTTDTTATPATTQRKLWPYKGEDDDGLKKIGEKVQNAVDTAVRTIAADPTLARHPSRDTSGYLSLWIRTYAAYLGNPAAVPDFYFARYGYAVETIATHLLASETIAPYAFHFQIAHGHTRPDVVVIGKGVEAAWIDITSEASKGHIFRKQGGGWASRAYVAEACYDMPLPSALAKGGPALDKETLERIEAASAHAAEQQAYLEIGRQAIGVEIGAALQKRRAEKGTGLAATDARKVILATCKEKLGDKATASLAKSVLYMLDQIEVTGQSDTGTSWANWAFSKEGLKSQQAKTALIAFGQRLQPPKEEEANEEMESEGE